MSMVNLRISRHLIPNPVVKTEENGPLNVSKMSPTGVRATQKKKMPVAERSPASTITAHQRELIKEFISI